MKLDRWKQHGSFQLKILFEDDECLILRLKNMGVNPAGNARDIIYNQESRRHESYTILFDYESEDKLWNENIDQTLKDKKGVFRGKIKEQILSILFQRLFFGFESSGLGFVCLNEDNNSIENIKKEIFKDDNSIQTTSLKEIANSSIRILGDKARYTPNSYEYSAEPLSSIREIKKLKNYIEKCAEVQKIPLKQLEKVIQN